MLTTVVDQTTYKPGWDISLRTMHHVQHLWIHAEVQDSNPPHDLIEIDHVIEAPQNLDTDSKARQFVRDAVLAVERHEVGEWLRFGNDRPFLPSHGTGNPYA